MMGRRRYFQDDKPRKPRSNWRAGWWLVVLGTMVLDVAIFGLAIIGHPLQHAFDLLLGFAGSEGIIGAALIIGRGLWLTDR